MPHRTAPRRLIPALIFVAVAAFAPAAQAFDTFAPTGSLTDARSGATSTLLRNGKVLITGGGNPFSPAGPELYDPSTGQFTTTGKLTTARTGETATLLPNGKVLIAGGLSVSSDGPGGGPGGGMPTETATAELYDPATGQFTPTGNLTTARHSATATLLPNGKVLIAGGGDDSGRLSSAELYDPATGQFTTTGSLTTARDSVTAVLLPNGKVLIAGGYSLGPVAGSELLASAELYDPVTGQFTTTGSLTTARDFATATLLPNGKVLIAGGVGNSASLASAELYDPATGQFTNTGNLTTERYGATSTLLTNGKVLVAGGASLSSGASASAELYDPSTGQFTATGSLTDARYRATATLIPNGNVLIAGGSNLTSADVYTPDPKSVIWTVGSFADFNHGSGIDLGEVAGGAQGTTVRTVFANTTSLAITDDPSLFTLGVTGASTTSKAFRVISEKCVGAWLLPNQSCVIKLAFTPRIWDRGEVNAVLRVEDNTGSHLLPLAGTALEPPKFILDQQIASVVDANTVGFGWLTSDNAQFTISITQPVITTVKVKKGKKTVTKKVTTIKPFVIKTINNQAAGWSGDSITWDRKIKGKAAAKGKWTITIVAKSRRGTITKQLPITLG